MASSGNSTSILKIFNQNRVILPSPLARPRSSLKVRISGRPAAPAYKVRISVPGRHPAGTIQGGRQPGSHPPIMGGRGDGGVGYRPDGRFVIDGRLQVSITGLKCRYCC